MKNVIVMLSFVVMLLNSGGPIAAQETKDKQAEAESVQFCPVCGPEEEMEGLAFSYKYQDKKYLFCSLDCMKVFKKDPEKYLKSQDQNTRE